MGDTCSIVNEYVALPRRPEDHPLALFEKAKHEKRPLYVSGPMVRYSKLPFRALVRSFNTDLVYTPMMLAKEFTSHAFARHADFSTNLQDRPVIAQFAAKDPLILARAAELSFPYVDGIDLNCGCPQSWAVQEGIGAHLMHDIQLVSEMVKAVKARCGVSRCVSVKIRVHADLSRTVDFARQVESAGADYVTVHGRRRSQRSSEPVNLDAIKLVKENVSIPVVANGDATTLANTHEIAAYTGVDGVMSARGILSNPALFAGYDTTPWSCIERFIDYALEYGLHFALFQHHLSDMMERILTRQERKSFNEGRGVAACLDWLDERFVLRRRGEEGFGVVDEVVRR
ncbi:tRNA dihydrouridine synthase [Saitoella coloradoensis]